MPENELTSKQDGFSQSMVQEEPRLTQIDAYKANYNCEDMSDEAIYVEASRLMDNPKITLRIASLRETVTEANLWSRRAAFEASMVNLAGSQADHQWTAANGAVKLAAELAGLASTVPNSVAITKITVIKNYKDSPPASEVIPGFKQQVEAVAGSGNRGSPDTGGGGSRDVGGKG